MASTGSCPFCGGALRSDQKTCPNCGAKNPGYVTDGKLTIFKPKTVEELKEYCAERGMPLKRMRFFIDEDYRAPKAFGIYRDGDEFVVYKNKADGSRAVRYRGRDEAYAVRELHQKLVDECRQRGIDPDGGKIGSFKELPKLPQTTTKGKGLAALLYLLAFLPVLVAPALILLIVLGFVLSKLIQSSEHSWPDARKRVEEPFLNKPITFSEGMCYAWNAIRFGTPFDSSLTPRERQIKQQGGLWSSLPKRIPLLIVILLIWGAGIGIFIHNDRQNADQVYFDKGYYQTDDGRLYYHDDALLYFDSKTYDSDYTSIHVWYVTDKNGDSGWAPYSRRQLSKTSGKLLANNHLKRWYLGETWQPSFGGSDFMQTEVGKAYEIYARASSGAFAQGYYSFGGDTLWYRDGERSWSEWHRCPLDGGGPYVWNTGERLLRLEDGTPLTPEAAEAYYLGERWDARMGGTDYLAFVESQSASFYPKGYYRMNDGELYYNSGYSWYRENGSRWSNEGSYFESDDAGFDISYSSYFLDDDWESDWGDKSYEDWYESQHSSSSSSYSSSYDSSDSWSSSDYDSWDSSDTDWDSDW